MNTFIIEVLKGIIKSWRDGGRKIRGVIFIGVSFITIGAMIGFLADLHYSSYVAMVGEKVGITVTIIGGLVFLTIYSLQKSRLEEKQEKRIEEVEQRVHENPKETQAAWELARVKLESYLNRNLSQVRSIFWLTMLVMLAGFALISVGVYKAFEYNTPFNASILTVVSGIIINFIGGTFLVLYKSTMSQAKEYVAILERINAVGMSVQIIENLDDSEDKLKQKTTAHVAKQLLDLYGSHREHNSRKE